MEQTVEMLRTKYMVAWISYRGLQRLETFPIPREALREAVLNALIHKDYSSGTPIQIRVHRDRLWIWNPGSLPPKWTAKTLLAPHVSQPPNPDIASTFFRAGLIEAWGRGYEKIRDACREAGSPEPEVEYDGGGVWLRWSWLVPDVPERLDPSQRPVATDPVTGQVMGQVTGQVAAEVTRLAAVIRSEMSRAQIQVALGLRGRENFELRYLKPALVTEVVEMTIPHKPNSRLQKYRLTAKGRALLAKGSKER